MLGEHPARGVDSLDIWHVAKLRTFDVSSASIPTTELSRYLARHPEVVYRASPAALERVVAEIYGIAFSCEARHVGGSGDGGVDILVLDADSPLLIQVKRRASRDAVESVTVVRELVGTLVTKGAHRGMVISTAKRFSSAAVRTAQLPELVNRGYSVELHGFETLRRILGLASPTLQKPWEQLR